MDSQKYSYFKCIWIIRPLTFEQIKTVFLSGSANFGLFFEAPARTVEGFWMMGVIARVVSQSFLDEYVRQTGNKVGLDCWTPVYEENWTAWRTLTASATPEFMSGIQMIGNMNSELDRKYKSL